MQGRYITYLVRKEFDENRNLISQRIVDWKVGDGISSVGDFPAQALSMNFEYRTVGTFLKNIADLNSYVKQNGMIWSVVPPQAQI